MTDMFWFKFVLLELLIRVIIRAYNSLLVLLHFSIHLLNQLPVPRTSVKFYPMVIKKEHHPNQHSETTVDQLALEPIESHTVSIEISNIYKLSLH